MPTKKPTSKPEKVATEISVATPFLMRPYNNVCFITNPTARIDRGAVTDPNLVAQVKERVAEKGIGATYTNYGFSVAINDMIEAGFGDMRVRTVVGSFITKPSEKTATLATLKENLATPTVSGRC